MRQMSSKKISKKWGRITPPPRAVGMILAGSRYRAK